MELVQSGVSSPYEVTFSLPDLDVGMSVYDTSGLSPVLVLGPVAMDLVYGNTYYAKFTATEDKSYVIVKAVYTDGTFTTLDDTYSQGSESIYAKDISGGGGGGSSNGDTVIGFVTNDDQLIGVVTC